MIPPEISQLAAEHLTDRQRQVFNWHERDGIPLRRIATMLDQTHSSVQDSFDGACRKLRKHGVKFTKDGRPYKEHP